MTLSVSMYFTIALLAHLSSILVGYVGTVPRLLALATVV